MQKKLNKTLEFERMRQKIEEVAEYFHLNDVPFFFCTVCEDNGDVYTSQTQTNIERFPQTPLYNMFKVYELTSEEYLNSVGSSLNKDL